MVVCIDKLATVRMYKKVRKYWDLHVQHLLSELQALQQAQPLTEEMIVLSDTIAYMQQTEMAIVLSNAFEGSTKKSETSVQEAAEAYNYNSEPSNEDTESPPQESSRSALLAAEGVDLKAFQNHKTLEADFKDANKPLRIVFVCAMWMTGFDVPSLSTIYLDRPMRGHTLMQTIARANFFFCDKI